MSLNNVISDIPSTINSGLTKVVNVINKLIVGAFGDVSIYFVVIMAVTCAFFTKKYIEQGRGGYIWLALLIFLFFAAMRWLGIGG